jgi:hypothetical protein
MPARDNFVNLPPSGFTIAIQYFRDDMPAALRLARLIADIEAERRDDVNLALCPRFDLERTPAQEATFMHCAGKFPTFFCQSEREGTGHPSGSNQLAAGILDRMAASWRAGTSRTSAVFLVEADGVPLRRDWIDRLLAEHARALRAGKRITGDLVDDGIPHVNGSCIIELSAWLDHPSMHETPPASAWDLHHAPVMMAECRPTRMISNLYGSRDWSHAALAGVAKYGAWLANTKDDTAIEWCERTLVSPRDWCGQCGSPYTTGRACGPTHAVMKNEFETGVRGALATEKPTPAPGPRRVTVKG